MATAMTQREKAIALREMHNNPPMLVLCNAWDAASARVVELAGFRAIATTSGGVAFTLGYPDGEYAPRDDVLAGLKHIVDTVSIPVTCDFISGYGRTIDELTDSIRALIATGAVGLNFEDATHDPAQPLYSLEDQVERIKAVRAAAEEAGVPLVINARTDVLRFDLYPEEQRLTEAIRRANAYRAAGADCLLALGARDAATIGRLAREIDGPINVLAGPGTPAVPELAALGVARVSVGTSPMLATLGLLRKIAEEISERGTYTTISEFAISHAEGNQMFAKQ